MFPKPALQTRLMFSLPRRLQHRHQHQAVRRRLFTATPHVRAPYLVYAPDRTDPSTLTRRMAVRPRHFLAANKLIEQGIIKVAGGLVTPETEHAAPPDRHFVGSVLIYDAESLEDAKEMVEGDLYWTEGVWDKEKLIILPIIMATTLQDRAGVTQPTAGSADGGGDD